MTKIQIISDIMLRISGGKPSDDIELEQGQVAFWIDQVLGSLIKNNLDDKLRRGESVDGVYFTYEYNLKPVIDSKPWMDKQESVYIPLCKTPMSLYHGGEIVYMETSDGRPVNRTTLQKLGNIKSLTFSKPSLSNLVYHRDGDRIYINGLNEDNIDFGVFNIWYVARPDLLSSLADSAEVKMGEDIPAILTDAVAAIAQNQVQDIVDEENDNKQELNNK